MVKGRCLPGVLGEDPLLSSKDEVAHTVTESRVLQNTRHPFLTVHSKVDPGEFWNTSLLARSMLFFWAEERGAPRASKSLGAQIEAGSIPHQGFR